MMRKFIIALLALVLLVAGLWGLERLVAPPTVNTKVTPSNPQEAAVLRTVSDGNQREQLREWVELAMDDNRAAALRLGACLAVARETLRGAVAGVEADRLLYNNAVRTVVRLLREKDFHPIEPADATETFSLVLPERGTGIFDPADAAELFPADQVRIEGLRERSLQEGFGLPYVAVFERNSAYLRDQPGVPDFGLAIPLTAVITFEGTEARMRFFRTFAEDEMEIAGETVLLAGDFSAPLAVMLSRGKNRARDIRAMLFTDAHIENAGLFQFQPYDPDRIPVVFVHGLLARPESWTHAVNALLGDRDVRKKYQFWYFLYPTGLPVWAAAAGLRTELDRFNTEFEPLGGGKLERKVIVGHSMGGLISNLMIRRGGDALWGQFSDQPLEEAHLPPPVLTRLRRIIDFEPREDVERVIFVATPHRGSPVALRPAIGLVARIIRLPMEVFQDTRESVVALMREDVRDLFAAPANSLRFLRENSPLVTSILELPRDKRIAVHSIIGNQGADGNLQETSDGVVPYRSAHLQDVASETVIPSDHSANAHPQGIEAIRGILLEPL